MKKQDDRIIAEKLSSLESLPEGYKPNLNAKWSIIQQTTSKKTIFGYRKLIGIAACIVLLIGFFITLNYMHKSTTPVFTQKEQKNGIEVPVEQKSDYQQALVSKEEKSHSKLPLKNVKALKVEPPLDQIETPNEEVSQAPVELPVVETASIAVPDQQKSKQRYVEVNFNEPVKNELSPEKNVALVKVKFTLKREPETSANSENKSSLRIRQNF